MGLLARAVYRSGAHLAISLDPDGVGELLLLRALPLSCADDDDDNDEDDHCRDDDDNGGDDDDNVFGSDDEEPLTKRVFTGQ